MPKRLNEQINVKLSGESFARLEQGARKEWRSLGEMGRHLIDWALLHYEESGSLQALAERSPHKRYTRRVSQELQDEVYAALEIILEHAPSALVKNVRDYLTERAGKYGDKE